MRNFINRLRKKRLFCHCAERFWRQGNLEARNLHKTGIVSLRTPLPPQAFPLLLGFLVLFLAPSPAFCTLILSDTTWSGTVSISEDVLIPEGVTLTIAPGTAVLVTPSDSTKTDPEFLSSLTEITVRGTLKADGTDDRPITFSGTGDKQAWAGIIIDGGSSTLRSSIISDAETGLTIIAGSVAVSGSTFTKNRCGMLVQGNGTVVRLRKSRIRENEYGLFLLNGAKIESTNTEISENRKKDRYEASAKVLPGPARDHASKTGKKGIARVYRDEVLIGTVRWQGRIEVAGIVRVPEKSRLIIVPGTVVEFRKKDTNHDNIGENGLLVQGVIIAKGTRENPIIFRSAEKHRKMGDWDSINIMNSDKAQNLIEFCRIEDAYRGLHFHFSHVAVTDTVLRNNYRGIQFQESTVEVRGSGFYGNKSAFQARDSEILFTGNVIEANYTGMNLLRDSVTIRDNVIANNAQEGLRLREGLPMVEGNLLAGNRQGMMITDAVYGGFTKNVISGNLETGVSVKGTDTIEISGNVIQANGLNGINIQDSNASVMGNLISDNGERGVGVQSFHGTLAANNIVGNRLYDLGVEGPGPAAARMNWWGGTDPKKTISDGETDPAKGRADYLPVLTDPAPFTWPFKTISADAEWHGDILVPERITVGPGTTLGVSPGTRVRFFIGSGLTIQGKIVARGEKNAPIAFSSTEARGAGEWDEILLDHAPGSLFVHCIFENATWALHSHFTDLVVEGCAFRNNTGGMRFTSGPIVVRRSLFEKNQVGIRAFRGKALITENAITGNNIGIFVREKGGGLTITRNNLSGNSEYSIRNGDFNDQDVNAGENWWGEGDPAAGIYDARHEPGIGQVLQEPHARRPFPLVSPIAPGDNAQGSMP